MRDEHASSIALPDHGLLLLRECLVRAAAEAGSTEFAAWESWLRDGPPPGLPLPDGTPVPEGLFDSRGPADALPRVAAAVCALIERTLGMEHADRILLEAYEHITRGAHGQPWVADVVRLLPDHLLDAGELALLTQIRSLEEARASEAAARVQLQGVLDAAATGIIVIDAAGTIELVNEEAGRLFGHGARDLLGRSVTMLMPERLKPAHTQAVAQRSKEESLGEIPRPVTRRVEGLRADGTEFPLEVTVRPLRLPDGTLRFTAGVRDLSEMLALQSRMALADRMMSVGTLAAGAAHEINNPLAYVTMNVEFVLDGVRRGAGRPDLALTPGEVVEALEQALDGAHRIQKIVQDLRTFARAEPNRDAGVEVHRALETALRVTGNELRHRARVVQRFTGRCVVRGDEARLCQVFSNLLLNAAQATPTGAADRHSIEVTTERHGQDLRVRIADTGEGIAPERMHRVFDPFFTTRPPGQGLGLGLSICHAIVTGLGGHIEIAPRVGGGTVVTVTLPVAARDEAPTPPPAEVPRHDRLRVLIIDDEPLVCAALARALPDHRVTTETSARVALARLTAGESFDAILCDVMMPEMNAVQFWESLAHTRPEVRARVVFMTGGVFNEEMRAFLGRMPNPCLGKPLDLATLRRALERVTRHA